MKNLLQIIIDMVKRMHLSMSIPLGTFSKPNPPTEKPKTPSSDVLLKPSEEQKVSTVEKKVPTPTGTHEQFVYKMWPIAETILETFGIHPLITITQAAHESAWGVSGLTKEANNLFGYTGDSWAAQRRPVVWKNTQEYVNGKWTVVRRPFRKYDSWLLSVQDWATNISQRPRYQLAYEQARKGDIIRFAKEVHAAGYATDPNYPFKLIDMHKVVDTIVKKIINI